MAISGVEASSSALVSAGQAAQRQREQRETAPTEEQQKQQQQLDQARLDAQRRARAEEGRELAEPGRPGSVINTYA